MPIKGARVDGHTFIPQVMEKGALCTLTEESLGEVTYPYILVESCEQALKDLAEHYRKALDIRVVGITGSVGKTSTKEMIAAVSMLSNAVNEEQITWYEKQRTLNDSAVNSIKRPMQGGWGFGGENAPPIEACALALWGVKTSKRDPTKRMRIG